MMTLQQLESYAARLGIDERVRIARGCGNHQGRLLTLPRLENGETPLHYCPDCLTAFSPTGVALNAPGASLDQ